MPNQPPLRRLMRNLGRRNRVTGPNRVDIGDPYALTAISDAEVAPREAGLSEDSVHAIWESVLDYYHTGLQTAIGFCLRRRGRIVLERTVGYARGNAPNDPPDAPKERATPDTIFCAFSASKAITAMLIHMLDDRGLLHLDDPVVTYLPEFGRHGKESITIRHILIHKTGLIGLPAEPEAALDLITQP
ncbi:MAG: serine hydrolase domain-containing protein, partial [Myxococcota bacterium]